MKYTFLGFLMLLFGSAGLIIIVMFETITLNNDSEYYTLKEAMEAAMLESIDLNCFRISQEVAESLNKKNMSCDGQLKISEQKFVENFTRRFAANITGDVDDYTIDFYDIIESPPKASVVISSSNKEFKIVSNSIDIDNGLSGILEGDWYALHSEKNNSDKCMVPTDRESVLVDDTNFVIPDGSVNGGGVASGVISDSDDDESYYNEGLNSNGEPITDADVEDEADKQEKEYQEEQARIEAEEKAKAEAEAKAKAEAEAKAKEEAEKNNNESSDGG